MRRLCTLAAVVLLPLTSFSQKPRTKPVTDAEVARITRDAILIDTHNDVPSHTIDGYDIAKPMVAQTDLKTSRGYLGGVFLSVFVDRTYVEGNHSANRTLQMIDTSLTDIVNKYPGDFVFATTANDILKAHKLHKIAGLMGIEGGHAIEDSLRLLRDYYALGVRYMTLTHFNTNDWADAQGDITSTRVQHHNGLTPFGKDVVREMNRLGMIVDISHTADKTFYDALEVSTAPIIASHSSCRALSSHTRNLTDDMIKALGAKGGVININFECEYLSQPYYDKMPAMLARIRPALTEARKITDPAARQAAVDKIENDGYGSIPSPTLEEVVAQIDHAVKIGGINHVGIGTDFDGSNCVPAVLSDYSKFPLLTRALLEKGYSAEDIKKIYGGNMLRVLREVEARAHALRSTPPIETPFTK